MRNLINEAMYFLGCNHFSTAIVDGKFPASASFIDVSNFDEFAFIVKAGSLNSALTLQVKQDTSATQTGSIKDVTGATVVIGATDDDTLYIIPVEVAKLDGANSFRYVTLDISGAAGGDDYASVNFVGYNARHQPVTQPSGTTVVTPVAG
jgi:hypothetical protein